MKLLVTGSRRYNNYEELEYIINEYRLYCAVTYCEDVTLLLHGGAAGADALTARYARENGMPEKVIRPDYKKHYWRTAPLLRNAQLVKQADAIIAFYTSERSGGTRDTAERAKKTGKETWKVLQGKITRHLPILRLGLLSLTL